MALLGWHSLGTAFDCECGQRHTLPIEACHVGENTADRLADFARKRLGSTVLLVADTVTYEVAGPQVRQALGKTGKRIHELVFPSNGLEATEETARKTALAGEDVRADFYVGVGSGTVCDLAKAAATENKKPALLFPTAASMNGYTSGITALKVRGLKRTLPCQPALGIFADPAIIATAPQRMTAAGVADFLSKCSSAADWQAGHLLRGAYYCHRPREFNEGIQERLLEQAPAIGRGEPQAVGLVMEALLLSGFGMVLAGSSAPASGGEHLISHYLDMKHALYGTPNDLHGAQVGMATLHALRLWETILALEPGPIDSAQLARQHPQDGEIEQWILEDWGPEVGAEVLAQWREKRLGPDELVEEIERFKSLLPKFRQALTEDLLPARVAEQCIRESGGPVRPEELLAPPEEFANAQSRARYLRNRFTVLDLAAELNVE